jgi:hypothetical protein
VEVVFGNAWNYVMIIFIFSVMIDLTHLPYLLKTKGEIKTKRFGSGSRTRFHEIFGLALFSFLACLFYIFIDHAMVEVAAMCLVLHFSIDFITGKSMPFYPYSKREVFLNIFPYDYRGKILFEVLSTVIVGVFFWLNIVSLVL